MKPRSAKNKGARFQNEIAPAVRAHLADRGLTHPDEAKTATMSTSGMDIVLSPAAQKVFPFGTECKNQEKWSIGAWWEQTKANAGKLIPILFVRRNRIKPLVVLEASVFFAMLREISELARALRDSGGYQGEYEASIKSIREASGQPLRILPDPEEPV